MSVRNNVEKSVAYILLATIKLDVSIFYWDFDI